MENFFKNVPNNFLNNFSLGDLDINKILVIILLLTDQLNIEAIHVYKNNFVISLGTFDEN